MPSFGLWGLRSVRRAAIDRVHRLLADAQVGLLNVGDLTVSGRVRTYRVRQKTAVKEPSRHAG
jgi:hypothetical protein